MTDEEKVLDAEVQEEETAEVAEAETVDNHIEEDAEKWAKVFGALDALSAKIAAMEERFETVLGGLPESATTPEEEDQAEAESEVEELDKAFYARQARFL